MSVETLLDPMCAHVTTDMHFMKMVTTARKEDANMKSLHHMEQCRLPTTLIYTQRVENVFGILQQLLGIV